MVIKYTIYNIILFVSRYIEYYNWSIITINSIRNLYLYDHVNNIEYILNNNIILTN